MFDVWVISLAAVINGSTLDVCYRISIVDTVVVISCTLLLTLNVSLLLPSGKLFYALSDSHLLPPWLWMHREDNNQDHDKSCRSPSPPSAKTVAQSPSKLSISSQRHHSIRKRNTRYLQNVISFTTTCPSWRHWLVYCLDPFCSIFISTIDCYHYLFWFS